MRNYPLSFVLREHNKNQTNLNLQFATKKMHKISLFFEPLSCSVNQIHSQCRAYNYNSRSLTNAGTFPFDKFLYLSKFFVTAMTKHVCLRVWFCSLLRGRPSCVVVSRHAQLTRADSLTSETFISKRKEVASVSRISTIRNVVSANARRIAYCYGDV